jgi:PIN domain nuclease of toxin-antitoxin system
MRYIIDTHVLLWLEYDPEKLSPKAQRILLNNNGNICLLFQSLNTYLQNQKRFQKFLVVI